VDGRYNLQVVLSTIKEKKFFGFINYYYSEAYEKDCKSPKRTCEIFLIRLI
jgi:hypothetical protein